MRMRLAPALLLAAMVCVAPLRTNAQAPPPSAQPDPTLCTVAGSVVSANTGEPLRKAHIFLTPHGQGDTAVPFTVNSDSAGHFSLTQIPPGPYDLHVTHDNYLASSFAQRDSSSPGAVLTLTPSQKMTDLIFRLHATAVITGRVVDEDGDPLPNVDVTASARKSDRSTVGQSNDGGYAVTDDQGQFRIYELKPGKYILLANGDRMAGGRSELKNPYQNTYYPNVTDVARASIVEVKSGDEASSIDISLIHKGTARLYKVRGRVTKNYQENGEDPIHRRGSISEKQRHGRERHLEKCETGLADGQFRNR